MGVVLTALLFLVLFAVAGAQSLLVQGQLRLDTVDKQLREEQARYQELRKDLAQKESPERVVAAAHEQGMVTPSDLVYLQPTDADRPEQGGDSTLARSSDRDWSSVKPLLETPEP
jgi:cell division protein FtsL